MLAQAVFAESFSRRRRHRAGLSTDSKRRQEAAGAYKGNDHASQIFASRARHGDARGLRHRLQLPRRQWRLLLRPAKRRLPLLRRLRLGWIRLRLWLGWLWLRPGLLPRCVWSPGLRLSLRVLRRALSELSLRAWPAA